MSTHIAKKISTIFSATNHTKYLHLQQYRKYTTRTGSFQNKYHSITTLTQNTKIKQSILQPKTHQKIKKPSLYTISRRYDTEYQRPFSTYKGILDAMLVGSRHNYVRPSVTYAAGLGNTALRSIRLHPEDYIQAVPAHISIPNYLVALLEKRPSIWLTVLTILALSAIWDRTRRDNEIYDRAVDSIFAYKSRNFLIKVGERVFLETVLIMYHEGIIEPLEIPGENEGVTHARFVGEIQSMIAEIERHRDFRISTIPLNIFEVINEQKSAPLRYKISKLLDAPWVIPFHKLWTNMQEMGTEFDTPGDIERIQRGDIHVDLTSMGIDGHPYEYIDSSGVGSVFGLFYPLLTRYQHTPIELTAQAIPLSYQRDIRKNTAPLSKMVGRVRDVLKSSTLHDQFIASHRGGNGIDGRATFDDYSDEMVDKNIRHELPKYWDSDVDKELVNSYYLQRTFNLIKRVNDVDNKIITSIDGEKDLYSLVHTWMSRPYKALLNNAYRAKIYNYEPGDTPIFKHYYQKYNLVPYLNGLQHEMFELLLLRQRLAHIGKAVGVDDLGEGDSIAGVAGLRREVLDLLDTSQLSRSRLNNSHNSHNIASMNGIQSSLTHHGGTSQTSSVGSYDHAISNSTRHMTVEDDHGIIRESSVSGRIGNEALAQQARAKMLEYDNDKGITPLPINVTTTLSSQQQVNNPTISQQRAIDYVPGASHHYDSTSLITSDAIELTDQHSSVSTISSKNLPKLPTPRTPTVSSLYRPVKVDNMVEYLINNQYHTKGETILAESLALAQHTDKPMLYPGYTTHPSPIQERYYTRSLFNPIANARGETDDQRYIHGLLGAVDVVLLRNAHEYLRWVPLVPNDISTIWEHVGTFLQRHSMGLFVSAPGGEHTMPTRQNGYIPRTTLPQTLYDGYKGFWSPFTTRKDRPHYIKPEYIDVPPPETWREWLIRVSGASDAFYESRGASLSPEFIAAQKRMESQPTPYNLPPGQYMVPNTQSGHVSNPSQMMTQGEIMNKQPLRGSGL